MESASNNLAQGPGFSGPIYLPFSTTTMPSRSMYAPLRKARIVTNIFIEEIFSNKFIYTFKLFGNPVVIAYNNVPGKSTNVLKK